MKNYSKKAFSLIEISIVILIIGLLIAGVSKATDMLADSKLKGARSISKGSVVSRLSSLVLWLDVAQSESWPDNKRASVQYTTSAFKDINPQTIPNNNFSFSGTYTYTENTGSSLPSLTVGSSDISGAETPFTSLFNLNGTTGYSFYVVAKQKASQPLVSFCSSVACANAGEKIIVEFDASSNAKFTYPKTGSADQAINATASSSFDLAGEKIDIISGVVTATNANVFSLGGNAGFPKGGGATPTSTPVAPATFAKGYFVLESGAQLYEVIVVGEALDDATRQKIEKYLFDKYGVPNDKRNVVAFTG